MTSLGDTIAALVARMRERSQSQRFGGASKLQAIIGARSDPGDLAMFLYTPAGLAPEAPLVVVLHGCTQSADDYAEGAGWLDLADRFGFAVLAPQQASVNNTSLCFNWFEPADVMRDRGEAASIAAMIVLATATYRLDRRRVFVTGLSAGGAMAAVMLATYPEIFAGGAMIAGLPYGAARNVKEAFSAMRGGLDRAARTWGDKVRDATSHRGPWPTISIWHGDADVIVRPVAGEVLAMQWVDVHGAAASPTVARSRHGRPFMRWLSRDGINAVELHRIAGMAHGTPLDTTAVDGSGTAGPFLLDVGISSSLEIAESWGIADPRRARRPTEEPRPQATPHSSNSPAGARLHVSDVIEKALRRAGLMK